MRILYRQFITVRPAANSPSGGHFMPIGIRTKSYFAFPAPALTVRRQDVNIIAHLQRKRKRPSVPNLSLKILQIESIDLVFYIVFEYETFDF